MPGWLRAHASLLAIALSISGCGGGSSGGNGAPPASSGTPSGNTIAPPPRLPTAAELEKERNRSWAYRAVGGAAALRSGANGKGTKVAIIDSGVVRNDAPTNGDDKVDFNNRLDPASITVRSGSLSPSDGGHDILEHGNFVASIISSAEDGRALVGIAPKTTLLSIDADETCGDLCFAADDVALALRHARSNNADVINMSLGGPTGSNEAVQQLAEATDQGIVIVAAAGNSAGSLTFPAGFAGNQRLGGKLLAVGSVTEDLKLSSFSSMPSTMSEAAWYLVAPGEDVPVSDAFGQLKLASGTSFSAPFVSGAIAAIKSKFPFMRSEDIVELILTTAKDLGAPGIDLIYGRGLLDLAAASRSQGGLALLAQSGGSTGLPTTSLELGEAFGDALANAQIIKNAQAVDTYGRAFGAGLSKQIRRSELASVWQSKVLNHSTSRPSGSARLLSGDLHWQADEAKAHTRFQAFREHDVQGEAKGSFYWKGEIEGLGEARAGFNASPQNLFQEPSRSPLSTASMANPALGLTGSGDHAGLRIDHLDVGIHRGDGAFGNGTALASFVKLSLNDRVDIRHSIVLEDGVAFGSSGKGAFQGFGNKAQSQFFGIGLAHEIGDWRFGIDASLGQTHIESRSAHFGDWSTIWSTAFVMHGQTGNLWQENDQLGIAIGQPLRVEEGDVRAILPTAQRADGQLQFIDQRLKTTPSGRELRFEMGYEAPLTDWLKLNPWLMLRHEPGHDEDADDEAIFGINLKASW